MKGKKINWNPEKPVTKRRRLLLVSIFLVLCVAGNLGGCGDKVSYADKQTYFENTAVPSLEPQKDSSDGYASAARNQKEEKYSVSPASINSPVPASEPPEAAPSPAPSPAPLSASDSRSENNFDAYDNPDRQQTDAAWVLNTNTMKIHYPSCSSVKKIAPHNYTTSNEDKDTLINMGYSVCGICGK